MGRLLACADDADHLGADALDADAECRERLRGDALLLADRPGQQVLGADVVVAQHSRLLLAQHDHLARPLREPLEHPPRMAPRGVPAC